MIDLVQHGHKSIFLARLVAAALVVATISCSDDSREGAATDAQFHQRLDLEGHHIGYLELHAESPEGPGQDLALKFAAGGLANVRQFEIVLEFYPAHEFDLGSAVFVANAPFSTFGSGVDSSGPNLLRVGGATFGDGVEGNHTLGVLRLRMKARFAAGAWIKLHFLSLGPRSDERDSFQIADRTIGVAFN